MFSHLNKVYVIFIHCYQVMQFFLFPIIFYGVGAVLPAARKVLLVKLLNPRYACVGVKIS